MLCFGFEPGGCRMLGEDGYTELWRPFTYFAAVKDDQTVMWPLAHWYLTILAGAFIVNVFRFLSKS